mmetsp:Transcript_43032/g.111560  ORF Transcript_43032/g.111560 Transcript_43032/m.111560 type:complete len:201 (+) Transcript_43032:2275-2877(+)
MYVFARSYSITITASHVAQHKRTIRTHDGTHNDTQKDRHACATRKHGKQRGMHLHHRRRGGPGHRITARNSQAAGEPRTRGSNENSVARKEGQGVVSRPHRACRAQAPRHAPAAHRAWRAGKAASVGGRSAPAASSRQGVQGRVSSVGGRLRAGGLRGWRRAAAAATTTPFEAPRSRGRRRRARDRARRRERLGVTTISR